VTFSVAQTWPVEIGLKNTLIVQIDTTGTDALAYDAKTLALVGTFNAKSAGSGAAAGTMQTGYIIDSRENSFVWLIDQSAGTAASFDNAMKYANLGILCKCP
jgi:hypothetical protein